MVALIKATTASLVTCLKVFLASSELLASPWTFDHEELMLMMLYNTGTRLGLIHELRLMQCYLMPDEIALRELSESVIAKLKLMTDEQFAEVEFPLD